MVGSFIGNSKEGANYLTNLTKAIQIFQIGTTAARQAAPFVVFSSPNPAFAFPKSGLKLVSSSCWARAIVCAGYAG